MWVGIQHIYYSDTYKAKVVSSNSIPSMRIGDSEGIELDLGRQHRLPNESLRMDSSCAKEFTENKNETVSNFVLCQPQV